jgi:hypothetical protein
MQWELWHIGSANQLAACDAEADALVLVRELIGKGCPAEELSLLFEDESQPVEALPPALTGAELARRAQAAGDDRARRTA